jgi:hypothetical protein
MDNIWDDDAVQVSRNAPSRARVLSDSDQEDRPPKRARTAGAGKPLFNPESDDETNLPPDVGALFDGLDDDDYNVQPLPAQLNIEDLQRESDQRIAKKRMMRGDVMDVSAPVDADGKAAKPRKALPKLDENRCVSAQVTRTELRYEFWVSSDYSTRGMVCQHSYADRRNSKSREKAMR